MADRVSTVGAGGDYADPILWASAEGNVNDGDRAVGVQISDIDLGEAFWRPNQTFPNGGLYKGDTTVTGKTGDGRSLVTNSARVVLSPSSNINFEDLEFQTGAAIYFAQSAGANTFTRILAPGLGITVLAGMSATFVNVVATTIDIAASASSNTVIMTNYLALSRLIVRAENTLQFKNSISTYAQDWLLGRGTYTNSDTLVNYAHIAQNAPASDFGAGSSDYVVNSDVTAEMVDFANGDYRIKSTSALATAGEGGTFIGAFLESGGETPVTANGAITLPSLQFNGSATDSTSAITANGAVTLPSLQFNGSATDSTSAITANGAITLPSLQFNGSATDSTSAITANGAVTLPSLQFNGSATDSTSAITVNGAVTLPSLQFNGSAILGEVIPLKTINVNLDQTSFTINLTDSDYTIGLPNTTFNI